MANQGQAAAIEVNLLLDDVITATPLLLGTIKGVANCARTYGATNYVLVLGADRPPSMDFDPAIAG